MTGVPEDVLRIGQESGRILSDGSTGHHRAPARFLEDLWEIGWTDGRLRRGKKEVEEIVDSIKDSLPDPEAAGAARALRAAEISRLGAQADSLRSQATDVEHRFAAEPIRFSAWYAWLYIAAGMVLLLSDIAINLEMVGNAFQLRQQAALRWLLCIGIVALSGVSKLLFDEWLFSEKPHKWRRAAVLVISVVMLWALVAVTDVRTTYQVSLEAANGKSISKELESALRWAYLVLNIAFSLAGGYFLAFAMHVFSNRRTRRETQANAARAEAAFKALSEVPTELAVPDRGKAVARYRAIYLHGYTRGEEAQWTRWKEGTLYEQGISELHRRMARAFLGEAGGGELTK